MGKEDHSWGGNSELDIAPRGYHPNEKGQSHGGHYGKSPAENGRLELVRRGHDFGQEDEGGHLDALWNETLLGDLESRWCLTEMKKLCRAKHIANEM